LKSPDLIEVRASAVVVGAGPSGVAAALALEKAGIDTLVLDKARFPRDKICGDALSPDVVHQIDELDLLRPGLAERFRASGEKIAMPGLSVVSPSGRAFDMELSQSKKKLEGYVMPRFEFDQMLADTLRGRELIRFFEDSSVDQIEREGREWLLHTEDGRRVRCGIVIGADGVNSIVSKKIAGNTLDRKHFCAAMRVYCEGVRWERSEPLIELHFIREALPGYLWVFPLPNGRANVGIGMRSDMVPKLGKPLRALLEETLKTHPVLAPRFENARMLESIKGMGIPLGSKKRSLSGEGYLLCGDAASLVDPLTGEGIGNALRSGTYAGERAAQALESGRLDARFLSGYDKRVYSILWSELRMSTWVQKWFESEARIDGLIGFFEKSPRFRRLLDRLLLDDSFMTHWSNPRYYLKKIAGIRRVS